MILTIENQDYSYFTSYVIEKKFNQIADTFEFKTNKRLDIDYSTLPECQINRDGNLLMTGYVFAPPLVLSPKPTEISLLGYSKPGILEDSSISEQSYPLQFDNMNLIDIAEKLLKPYKIDFTWNGNVLEDLNKKYTKTTVMPGTSVKQYLSDLASQRNIFLTSNELGEIVFMRYERSKYLPVAWFKEGEDSIKSASLSIDSQNMHSEIKVLKQATKDNSDSAEYKITNPYMKRYKSLISVSNSGDIFDVDKAARNILSQELRGIQINLVVNKFVDTGRTIMLNAPSFNINTDVELFVEAVTINGTVNTEEYQLTCVLPQVYNDEPVTNIFE